MLRGNHETESVSRLYGFYNECQRRYSSKLWKSFTQLFEYLPLCALINDSILCMHGGISPEIDDFKQIENIPRPIDVPD